MQRRWWMVVAVMVGGSACAEDPGTGARQDPAEEQAEELGGLQLSLTAADSQGRSYRLRNANFTVSPAYWYYDGGTPPVSTVLSTEDDPDADRLSVRIAPGDYYVTLGGDWYIERLTPAGFERVQQVVLLSDAAQYAYVPNQWYTDVEYRFGVDGTLLDFRHGDLNVDISIELPGEGPVYPPYPSYDGGMVVPTDAGSSQPPTFVDAGVVSIR